MPSSRSAGQLLCHHAHTTPKQYGLISRPTLGETIAPRGTVHWLLLIGIASDAEQKQLSAGCLSGTCACTYLGEPSRVLGCELVELIVPRHRLVAQSREVQARLGNCKRQKQQTTACARREAQRHGSVTVIQQRQRQPQQQPTW